MKECRLKKEETLMADCSIEYPGYVFHSGHSLVLDWVLGTCFEKSFGHHKVSVEI